MVIYDRLANSSLRGGYSYIYKSLFVSARTNSSKSISSIKCPLMLWNTFISGAMRVSICIGRVKMRYR